MDGNLKPIFEFGKHILQYSQVYSFQRTNYLHFQFEMSLLKLPIIVDVNVNGINTLSIYANYQAICAIHTSLIA